MRRNNNQTYLKYSLLNVIDEIGYWRLIKKQVMYSFCK